MCSNLYILVFYNNFVLVTALPFSPMITSNTINSLSTAVTVIPSMTISSSLNHNVIIIVTTSSASLFLILIITVTTLLVLVMFCRKQRTS